MLLGGYRMERKNKIWLGVLLVLLLAAIVAIVWINNEKTSTAQELVSTAALLDEERDKYLALEEALAEATGQAEQLAADKDALEESLNAINADLESAQQDLAQAQQDIALKDTSLTDAQSELEALKVQVFDLEAAQTSAQEELTALQSELDAANERVAQLDEQLAAEGESYLSTQLGSVIVFDQAGLVGDVTIVNNVNSGNAMVLEIEMDGETIFVSDAIAPGESLESIALEAALSSGNHAAIAIQKTYDAGGVYLSGVRIPVTLIVP